MAFQSYDQYIQNFGAALQGAGIQPPMQPDPQGAFGAPPNGAPPPQEGMVESGPPPQQQPPIPAPQAAGAFGPAPEGAAPAPPSGPFSPAPGPEAAPGQPPSGAFTPKPGAEDGLSMKKLFEDSSKEERKELADQMEQQVPDLIEAANNAAKQDPEGASKWDSFLTSKGWEREEAAAWLMEFGLRMMQAGGSGEGNFLSDVGGSAMGATEARRAFKTEEEEKGFKREDREWEAKKREREEGSWEADDRETARERKRKSAEEQRRQETHDKNINSGNWNPWQVEGGHIKYYDPDQKKWIDTGERVDPQQRSGRAGSDAFTSRWNWWSEHMLPPGATEAERKEAAKNFLEFETTSRGDPAALVRLELDAMQRFREHLGIRARTMDPEELRQMEQEARDSIRGDITAAYGHYGDRDGGRPGGAGGEGEAPSWTRIPTN